MEHNDSFYSMTKSTCDLCGFEGPVSLYHLRGEAVIAQCSCCDPRAWDKAGQRAKEAWLSGDDLAA